ncbi:MAG: DUF1467 family protein [Pseudomonadota bacterium]
MNIVSVVIVFLLWWWVAFMAVLPLGVEARWEAEDDGVKGADPGAPTSPRIKQKMWLATKVALVLTAITAALIMAGLFNFRE